MNGPETGTGSARCQNLQHSYRKRRPHDGRLIGGRCQSPDDVKANSVFKRVGPAFHFGASQLTIQGMPKRSENIAKRSAQKVF